MYMSRPIDKTVLACFVSMALMDDQPVRRSPRKTVQRFDALVNGLPSGSSTSAQKGCGWKCPRDSRSTLPPYFAVRCRWLVSP
jgi:hypothetical protein